MGAMRDSVWYARVGGLAVGSIWAATGLSNGLGLWSLVSALVPGLGVWLTEASRRRRRQAEQIFAAGSTEPPLSCWR